MWKPASELLFHSSAQMEAARSAAQVSKQAATQAAVEDEMRAPHAVGDVVYVKTFSAGGEQHFRAEVHVLDPEICCITGFGHMKKLIVDGV